MGLNDTRAPFDRSRRYRWHLGCILLKRAAIVVDRGIYYGIHAANASWLGAANEQAMMEYIPRGQNDARAQFG